LPLTSMVATARAGGCQLFRYAWRYGGLLGNLPAVSAEAAVRALSSITHHTGTRHSGT